MLPPHRKIHHFTFIAASCERVLGFRFQRAYADTSKETLDVAIKINGSAICRADFTAREVYYIRESSGMESVTMEIGFRTPFTEGEEIDVEVWSHFTGKKNGIERACEIIGIGQNPDGSIL